MNPRNMLIAAQNAVTECEFGNVTPDYLDCLLDFFARGTRAVRALPGQDNAPLRAVGARMDGWLHSIHDPEVVRSRPLLLLRLRQIRDAVQDLLALEDARDCVIPALPPNVLRFTPRGAAPGAPL